MSKNTHPTIETLRLGALDTNCYICWCPQTREAVIIDPADAAETIIARIIELQLTPTAILLTHGHFDHVLALLELKLSLVLPIFLHKDDLFLIKTAQKSALHWLKREVDPVPLPTHYLHEGSVFAFGHCSLAVIATPGHTPGSVCFVSEPRTDTDAPLIFTGDTLFKNSVGRTDFTYSSPKALETSLQRLFAYPNNTLCYPGHGEPTTIAQERS